jgi:phosphatidylinositol 3-kinase
MDIAEVVRTPPLRTVEVGQSKTEILRDAIRGNLTARTPASVIGRLNLSNKLNFPEVGGDSVEIPIPLDPALCLVRVEDGKSFCIKSAKAPFVVSCEVFNRITRQTESRRYMFKTGDDLRQDQLIIQLISLFDNLFKSYGLDLKLTPYKVLATSTDDGFVEFVADSNTLSSVLANHGNDLLTYFRSIRPKPDAQYGVDPTVLDAFARSCAGYCAITYVLGIGDRHLDNLLITTDGRLFHVDFGYILGRDPKPFPPPMKLCREMVDGMGGTGSVYYRSFVSKCTQAFLIIRRHASLLISLLYLAAEANLKDMREQDPTLAILKVQKRLMPELSDEVAEQQMVNLINESTNALFPVVMEKLHKWAIYWRN